MNKVIVIGCPGAGKSTLARKLQKHTGLPLYYLDLLWHKPDRTNHTQAEFDACLDEILRKPAWIIDGNYMRTLELRLKFCDTVFFLDYPTELCLEGAAARVGKERVDMPWVEDALDDAFRQWILGFAEEQRPRILELLENFHGNVYIMHSIEDTDRAVQMLSAGECEDAVC